MIYNHSIGTETPKTDVLQDRYPGLRSFNSNEQALFFGRKKEIDDLLDLVRAEQITVLFSKSGLGKSSLLNAGLAPKLAALNYRTIPVRFQKQKAKATDGEPTPHLSLSDNELSHILLTQLHGEFQVAWSGQAAPGTGSPFYNTDTRQLWEEVKTHPFPNGAIPVFIFDQFEELFIYDQYQRDVFMRQLAELMNDQAPTRILNELLKTDVDDRTLEMMEWSKQPLAKCLFSIRADRLFEMHKLRVMIPIILRNQYELLALEDDRARAAIDRPAQADGLFNSPKFTYEPATRESIIRVLSGRKYTDGVVPTEVEDCEIESSQLQIVCHYIENKIRQKVASGGAPIVGPDIIHNDRSINRILDKFYRTQSKEIGSPEEIEKVRLVLENDLIVNGHRVGLAAAKMRKSLGDNETADRLIDKLMEVRLIRADDTHLGRTYELSHDTLIEPVEKVKQLRLALQNRITRRKEKADQVQQIREQELKFTQESNQRKRFQRLTIWLFIFAFVALGASYAALHSLVAGRLKLAAANSDWAVDEYNAGNQRMAYRLWESNDALLRWIPCSKSLIPCTKDSLGAKTAEYMMVPFSGATTQMASGDTRTYIASLHQNNMLEVWQSMPGVNTYDKLDSLYKEPGKPNTNAMSATQLQLRNNHLVVFKHDSLLQVFDLAKKEKVFPRDKEYYSLPTSGRTVLLPPKGKWMVILDCNRQAALFNLTTHCTQHRAFTGASRALADLALDSLNFSDSEEFLLVKHPGNSQYDLYDLRADQPPREYPNTTYASFSPTGKYLITVEINRQVIVHNTSTNEVLSSFRLPAPARITELLFDRTESKMVVCTTPVQLPSSPDKATYTLYTTDLSQPAGSLHLIAANLSRYWPFRLADRLIYSTNSSLVNYDLVKGYGKPLPSAPESIQILQTGKTNLLYQTAYPAGPANIKRYLYNVVSGMQTNVTPFLASGKTGFSFYAPAEKPDEKLIQVTPRTLTFFTINHLQLARIGKPDSLMATGTTRFQPASLTLSGPMINVKNQDDVVLSFFVDNQKNKLSYLVNRIYPKLSKGDIDAAGLPD